MKIIRFFLPRIEYVLFAAVFWGVAASGPILLNSDGDLPRHLFVGSLTRATGHVDTVDIFSFRTTGFPSIPHEWLSQVIYSFFNDLLGLGGVVLLAALLFTAVSMVLFYDAMRRSNSLLASLFVTGLAVSAGLIHLLPRPHLFSYLFTAIWILLLEQLKEHPRRWWLLPLMMLAWVNLHGMFVWGIAIWLAYLVGDFFEKPAKAWFGLEETRSMLTGGLLAILATFFSPSGFGIWGAIASLGGNAYIKSRIVEYQSADFQMPETWSFILLLLLCLVSFGRSGNKTPWTYLFLIVPFAGLALYSSRMLPQFAIVAAPIAAQAIAGWLRQDFANSRLLTTEANITKINQASNGWIWILAVALAVLGLFKANISIDPKDMGNNFDPAYFPIQALDWLHTHPQSGHVFNEFDWGGYMLLKLWPDQQIFMDGHTHIYGEDLTREYEQVITLTEGWETVFAKYQIEWAIVRAKSSVARTLEGSGWEKVYFDETAVILRRGGE